jgi:hypothetical protein
MSVMTIQISEKISRRLESARAPAIRKLDMDCRICLYSGGPVVLSRLRKIIKEIDGKEGKASFLAMYRRFRRIVRDAHLGRLAQMQEAVTAAQKTDAADELAAAVCVHEIGHVAIPIYYRSAVNSYPVRFSSEPGKEHGIFEFGDLGWDHEIAISILHTASPENRPLLVESCERVLLCDLAGEAAVFILLTDEPPEIAFLTGEDPSSDMFKVRRLVREIRGFDDKEYQVEMQLRCAEILMVPNIWEAIIVAASFLYERNVMDGGDVEDIFRAMSAPQFDFGANAVQGLDARMASVRLPSPCVRLAKRASTGRAIAD